MFVTLNEIRTVKYFVRIRLRENIVSWCLLVVVKKYVNLRVTKIRLIKMYLGIILLNVKVLYS